MWQGCSFLWASATCRILTILFLLKTWIISASGFLFLPHHTIYCLMKIMLVSLLRSIYWFSLKQPNKIQIKTGLRHCCCFHDYIYWWYWSWLVGAQLEKKMFILFWPGIEFNFGGLMNQLNLIELQISLVPHTNNWSQILQWEWNSEQT